MRSFKQLINPFLNRHFELDHTECPCHDMDRAFWRDGEWREFTVNGVNFVPENPLLDLETGDIVRYIFNTYGNGAVPLIIRDLEETLKDYWEKNPPRGGRA